MPISDRFGQRIKSEQDGVLSTLQLVAGNQDLEERLCERLVDLLLDGLFVDLRSRFLAGEMTKLDYQLAITELAGQARSAGLLPFRARRPGYAED